MARTDRAGESVLRKDTAGTGEVSGHAPPRRNRRRSERVKWERIARGGSVHLR